MKISSLENRLPQVMAALRDVCTSGMYSEGPYTHKVEQQLSIVCRNPSVVLNSCGSALYVAFRYMREVHGVQGALVQNNTFYASGAMALLNGLKVALVDSRPDCPSMCVASLEAAYKATGYSLVVLTHVAGWLAKDYIEIAEFCRANGLLLLEDCAHAVGLPMAGTLGYASCWSFYPTKAVPCGEGGALSTGDLRFLQYANRFRQYGKHRVDGVVMYDQGMNLRMSEFDAAVLSIQLDHLDEILAMRREDARALQLIAPCLLTGESNYYKYPVARAAAQGLQRVGKVYARTDQLHHSLVSPWVWEPVSLEHSFNWADAHECLPCGEGLYDCLSTLQLLKTIEA